jgi:large subunit ribosomal protein L22
MTAPLPEKKTEVRAVAKYVHVSPRKARLVVDHIRGRSVPEARTILAFSARAVAHEIEKVLRSAVANAETNPNLRWDGDELVIAAAFVDEGPTLKRWRARARGHTSPIMKRTCHITVAVRQPDVPLVSSDSEGAAETPKRARRSGGAAAAPAKTSRKKKEAVAS